MIILTIRTDNPIAEISLYNGHKQIAYEKWQAHRQLAETIHQKIQTVVKLQGQTLKQIKGVVVYGGPGSFTGLRIGIAVANSLAFGLEIPIVATTDDNWLEAGISKLLNGETDKIAVPDYGAPPSITKQRK